MLVLIGLVLSLYFKVVLRGSAKVSESYKLSAWGYLYDLSMEPPVPLVGTIYRCHAFPIVCLLACQKC